MEGGDALWREVLDETVGGGDDKSSSIAIEQRAIGVEDDVHKVSEEEGVALMGDEAEADVLPDDVHGFELPDGDGHDEDAVVVVVGGLHFGEVGFDGFVDRGGEVGQEDAALHTCATFLNEITTDEGAHLIGGDVVHDEEEHLLSRAFFAVNDVEQGAQALVEWSEQGLSCFRQRAIGRERVLELGTLSLAGLGNEGEFVFHGQEMPKKHLRRSVTTSFSSREHPRLGVGTTEKPRCP